MKVAWVVGGVIAAGVVFMLSTPGCLTDARYSVKAHCASKIRQLTASLLLYAAANDDCAPRQDWLEQLAPATKNSEIRSCPLVKQQGKEFGYAMNEAILGKSISKLDPATIALFDTDALGPSVIANLAAMSNRHGGGSLTGRLDGVAKYKRTIVYDTVSGEKQ